MSTSEKEEVNLVSEAFRRKAQALLERAEALQGSDAAKRAQSLYKEGVRARRQLDYDCQPHVDLYLIDDAERQRWPRKSEFDSEVIEYLLILCCQNDGRLSTYPLPAWV